MNRSEEEGVFQAEGPASSNALSCTDLWCLRGTARIYIQGSDRDAVKRARVRSCTASKTKFKTLAFVPASVKQGHELIE